jgi:hypothetical protein
MKIATNLDYVSFFAIIEEEDVNDWCGGTRGKLLLVLLGE